MAVKEAIQIGFAPGLKGEPDVINRSYSYDLFSPPLRHGIQMMLDEDIRSGIVAKNSFSIAS